MYSNPAQTPSWNPNAPPPAAPPPSAAPPNQSPSQTPAQQQAWSPQPNGQQYARPPPNQIPPITQALQQPGPAMQTLQPQHPDQYRALPPPQMYPGPYPQQPPMPYAQPQQPAPRQRTAIACRYCRRRKIRCSGFDQSEDGRCTNCQRFSQECVFTPVSAQTQAFVPAHSVWRGQQPPPNAQLYGAYGQPLRDPYPQPGQAPPPPQQQPGQYPPPPQGYQQPPYQQPPMQAPTGNKRPNDEPHTPTLPPPAPGSARPDAYIYPDPAAVVPTGASISSNPTHYHHNRNSSFPGANYAFSPTQTSFNTSPFTFGAQQDASFGNAPMLQRHSPRDERSSTDEVKDEPSSVNSVDSNDRKEERIRNGEIRDIGIQTDDRFIWKEREP